MPEKGRDYTQEAVQGAKGSRDPRQVPTRRACKPAVADGRWV